MNTSFTKIHWIAAGAALALACALWVGAMSRAEGEEVEVFEPSGSRHLVSENANAKEPASLLAVFVADDGARLTTFDR